MRVPVRDAAVVSKAMVALMVLAAASVCAQEDFGEASAPAEQVYARWAWVDAEVGAIFEQIAVAGGVDIVVDPRVTGRLTLTLTDKSWQNVLMIVCRMKNLVPVREEGLRCIYVMNEKDYRREQKERLASADLLETVQPLQRRIVEVNNMQAGDMREAVEKLLSERGELTVVSHNNSLIIYDTEKNIRQIRRVITELDVEIPQISIAAKIIEVSSGTLQNLGVQWGFFGQVGDQATPVSAQHLPGENVVSNAIDRLTYGILSSDRFAMTLEYLFQDNKGKVVAQPSITTLDNKRATIFMGSRIPLVTKDEAGNNEIRFEDAGTELTVTPHVTDGRRVMLEINAKKESPDAGGNIQSQNATTNVVVSDGETVVIAGLTSDTESEGEEGIPVLKNIPLIGNLFKRSNKTVNKADLLIFVTPHIIKKSVDGPREPAVPGEPVTEVSGDERHEP